MSAVTTMSTDILAGPALIIRPGHLSQVIERGNQDYSLAVRLGETAGAAVPVAQCCNLTILTGAAGVELLDVVDATWEDAEWQ